MINLFDPKYEPLFITKYTRFSPKATQNIFQKQFCGPAVTSGICIDNNKQGGFCIDCLACEAAFKNVMNSLQETHQEPRNPYALMTWMVKNELARAREQKFEHKPRAKTPRNILGEQIETPNPFNIILETL